MKNSVLADTGFWYALMDRKDRHHQRATTYLASCQQQLVTTWPVVTETCYLLLSRHSVEAAGEFLRLGAESFYVIYEAEAIDLKQATTLMLKYQNLPMDLADASLVLLAETLGHGQILSTDQRDFNAYRWKNQYPFNNLLFPEG